jgi:hypothetical protein
LMIRRRLARCAEPAGRAVGDALWRRHWTAVTFPLSTGSAPAIP